VAERPADWNRRLAQRHALCVVCTCCCAVRDEQGCNFIGHRNMRATHGWTVTASTANQGRCPWHPCGCRRREGKCSCRVLRNTQPLIVMHGVGSLRHADMFVLSLPGARSLRGCLLVSILGCVEPSVPMCRRAQAASMKVTTCPDMAQVGSRMGVASLSSARRQGTLRTKTAEPSVPGAARISTVNVAAHACAKASCPRAMSLYLGHALLFWGL
jgi:hypothetical protein